jgi:hypothetical protein
MAFAETPAPHQEQWVFCHRGRAVAQDKNTPETKINQKIGPNIRGAKPKCNHKRLVPIKNAKNHKRKNFSQGTRFKKAEIN